MAESLLIDAVPLPWPTTPEDLEKVQVELARAAPEPWRPAPGGIRSVAGCFACFQRGKTGAGAPGDRGWAGAALLVDGRFVETVAVRGSAGAAYAPGLLALREGPLLEAAIGCLTRRPEVLIVNATGRDHPRGAGLALHLGARLSVPTVGVTDRPLLATGGLPPDTPGAASPLAIGEDLVGYWLRTRPGIRPLAVHAAWRTDPEVALAVVLAATRGSRTPEPLRHARRAARQARASDDPDATGGRETP